MEVYQKLLLIQTLKKNGKFCWTKVGVGCEKVAFRQGCYGYSTHTWYTRSSLRRYIVNKNVACDRFADTAVDRAREIFAFNLLSDESETLQSL